MKRIVATTLILCLAIPAVAENRAPGKYTVTVAVCTTYVQSGQLKDGTPVYLAQIDTTETWQREAADSLVNFRNVWRIFEKVSPDTCEWDAVTVPLGVK